MDPIVQINKKVSVIAVFRDKADNIKLCQPVKMSYQGREVIFRELGLRHPTSAGKRMIHIFEVSDGSNDYRLSFDSESLNWTLLSMLEGHHA
ncbi:MAG: hypothetical protein NVS1B10_00110 [Candidatus Saccharimonadales bacterium]